MPKKDDILNLPYLTIKAVKGLNPILMDIECHQKSVCIHCGSARLRKKDSFIRQIRHESIGLKQTSLRIKTHKYHCKDCKRYFNQRLPGVRPYQRSTERLKEQVFIQHTQGISQQDLARTCKLGKKAQSKGGIINTMNAMARSSSKSIVQSCWELMSIFLISAKVMQQPFETWRAIKSLMCFPGEVKGILPAIYRH